MLLGSTFDSINMLDRAADYSWKRETIISNNIANADTPTYKRKDLDFSKVLLNEMTKVGMATGVENAASIAKNIDVDNITPKVYTDYENYSYRIDKNNVDPDTENVELASEQLRYQVLTSSLSNEFTNLRTVLK